MKRKPKTAPRGRWFISAAFLFSVAVCAGPEMVGPVSMALTSTTNSGAIRSSLVAAIPDSVCVRAIRAAGDTAAKAHLRYTQLTGYQRRVLLRLDSLAKVHCPAVVVPVPPPDTQPTPPPVDTVVPPPVDTVTPPAGSIAELPRQVPASGDPYPGRGCLTNLLPGANVSAALALARSGHVVCLSVGATYASVTLPSRVAGDTGWIVVRSAALPIPEGTRVRPSTATGFATISTANSEPALQTTPGTFGWYIAGVKITTTAPVGGNPATYDIVRLGSSGAEQDVIAEVPQRIVFSRVWIDGGTVDVKNCAVLNSGETAIVDSWIGNCHNTGQEGHGIVSWNGPGPHLVKNSHIEAMGINALWGGATPSIANLRAADITVIQSSFYKNPSWKVTWWPAKNHLELKNATRVLVSGNVFDGSWEEVSHGGAPIWLKSINDDGRCTWCETSHVTITRNDFRNIGMGIAINGSECYADTGCSVYPKPANHIAIQENLFTIANAAPYAGFGYGMRMGSGATDIEVSRNVIAGNVYVMLFLFRDRPVDRVTFRDNVWAMGMYPVFTDPGAGGLVDGATNVTWERMTLVGTANPSKLPPSLVISSESLAPLAAQIRATVQAATAGVVVPP
jgi:hypothetical protein